MRQKTEELQEDLHWTPDAFVARPSDPVRQKSSFSYLGPTATK